MEARSVLCTIQGESTNAASDSESCGSTEYINIYINICAELVWVRCATCSYLVESRSVLCTIQDESTNAASDSESCGSTEYINIYINICAELVWVSCATCFYLMEARSARSVLCNIPGEVTHEL